MKQILALFLSIAFCLSALAAPPYVAQYDISAGQVNITGSGAYRVYGTTEKNSITVNSKEVTLVLDNCKIKTSGTPAILLQGGMLTVTCTGSGSRLSGTSNNSSPVFAVAAGTELHFDNYEYKDTDTGKTEVMEFTQLFITSECNEAPAIGNSANKPASSITFASGLVVARGGLSEGAIGGAGNITVKEGGSVYAYAGANAHSAAIGEVLGLASETIDISGYVYAEAGTEGAAIGTGSESTAKMEINISSTATIQAIGINGAGVGGGSSSSTPQITIYGGSIKASSVHGTPVGSGQGTDPVSPQNSNGDKLEPATVYGAFGTTGHTTASTFKIGKDTVYSGKGHHGDGDNYVDHNIYLYLAPGAGTVSINKNSGEATFKGTVKTPTIFAPNYFMKDVHNAGTANLYLTTGQGITFTADGVSGYDFSGQPVVGEFSSYEIDSADGNTSGIKVESGMFQVDCRRVRVSDPQEAGIDIAPGAGLKASVTGSIVINGTTSTSGGIHVPENALFICSGELKGVNMSVNVNKTGSAAIGGYSGESSGVISLGQNLPTTVVSGSGAGIGGGYNGNGTVSTKTSITVTANGGGAGIGGGENGVGNVSIDDANVTSHAVSGAGIGSGAGCQGEPGVVTIKGSGSTISAYSTNGEGIGCGANSGNSSEPIIRVSGGSVKAVKTGTGLKAIGPVIGQSDASAYCCRLPGAMASTRNSIFSSAITVYHTSKEGDSGFEYTFSGQSHPDTEDLFFYLPDGTYTITGNNGKTYTGTVSGSDVSFTQVPEPAFLGLLALAGLFFARKQR